MLPVMLLPMPLSEHVVNDYQTIKLSLKAHPMSFLRARCRAERVTDNRQLKELANGKSVSVAGIVLVRHGAAAASLVSFPIGPRLLTMVMRSFPLQGSPTRVRQFFPLAARLSHTPVVLLEHAADPAARVAEAATLLREASARFTSP